MEYPSVAEHYCAPFILMSVSWSITFLQIIFTGVGSRCTCVFQTSDYPNEPQHLDHSKLKRRDRSGLLPQICLVHRMGHLLPVLENRIHQLLPGRVDRYPAGVPR